MKRIDALMQEMKSLSFGWLTLAISGGATAFAMFAFIASLPANPISPPWSIAQHAAFSQALPEGWGFFTKSQRDEYFELYSRKGRQWKNAFAGPQSAPRNLFGLSRTPRAQGIEIGAIEGHIKASDFVACEDGLDTCAPQIKRSVDAANSFADPLLCGDFILVERKPVPWNWASFSHVTMPARYTRLHIRCK